MRFELLFKRTATGAVQEWSQEIQGDSWRTISGQVDGQKVTSGWHKCEAKNTGKKNATTAEQQAIREVAANYEKRLSLGYFKSQKEIDGDIYFKPMLAKKYEDYSTKIWKTKGFKYTQPKLDGMRCVATVDGLFSRTGKRIPTAPHIHNELKQLGIWNADETIVVDGEIYNHDLRDDFDKLMSLARKTKPTAEDLEESKQVLQYHVYDICLGDESKFSHRHHLLVDLVGRDNNIIKIVPTSAISNEEEMDTFNGYFLERGFEGQMLRLDESYENKRSNFLLKRKEFIDEEFEIVDIEEGTGNRAGMAGNLICKKSDGRFVGAGIKGSHEYAKQLLINKAKYIGNQSEATIRYFRLTPDGIPRFPVAVYLYEGKRDS